MGAPQTIDQVHLYGRAAKWFAELPLLDGERGDAGSLAMGGGTRGGGGRGGPAGPVHVNLPFREPLLPDASLARWRRAAGAAFAAGDPAAGRTLDPSSLDAPG